MDFVLSLRIATESILEVLDGCSRIIELSFTGVKATYKQKYAKYDIFSNLLSNLVSLTTTQVETLFGELEYIEPRLKALGVALADEKANRA